MQTALGLSARRLILFIALVTIAFGAIPASAFVVGDRVQVINGPIYVRTSAGGSWTGYTQPTGSQGTVTGGPTVAQVNGAGTYYTWYNVNFDTGTDGWVAAENQLVAAALPNLTPYLSSGWSDKLVVSRTTGATTDSIALTTSDALYVNWSVINNGSAAAGAFYVYVYVDGTYKGNGSIGSLSANYSAYWHDLPIGSLSAGTHTIMITADATSAIAESNEGDNSYSKTITVSPPPLPNLTPYQPSGWSDRIVVSTTSGATTDSTPLYTTDTLYVDWGVINNGSAAASASFYTTLYIDGVARQSWQTPGLGANTPTQITGFSLGSLSAGTHTLMLSADSTSVIAESNEADNSYTKTITITTPSLPNLAPYQPPAWSDKLLVSRTTGATTDSTTLTTADSLYVDWAMINNGTAATGTGFYNTLYIDGVVQKVFNYTASLSAGAAASVTDYSIGSLTAGSHTIAITLDSGLQIAESSEADNSYSKTISVAAAAAPNLTPYQPPGWSDKLVVSRAPGIYTDSTSLTTADSLYVDWGVVNNGNAAAATTFYTYLSVDGVLKGSWYTPSLNANYYTAGFNFSIGPLSAGTHTVSITTDATATISESNEGDNTYSKIITVGSVALADFAITSISLSPPSPQPGQPFTAYVTVKNQGSASANGNWLDVWANQPASQSCGANGDTWASVGSLSPGQSQTFTFAMTAPASAGSFTFRAFVDSACQTAESTENNNQTTLAYSVAQASQLPDFVVTAISLNPPSPQAGQTFSANVTVQNQGTGAGDGGWLDVWANQPSAPTCGTDGNTWASVGPLAAGQTKTFTLTLTAPSAAGSFTFRAFVDSYCQTAEGNDGNNQTTLTYTVPGAAQLPDFLVTAISFNPPQPIGGQPFTAYVTVKNQGLGSGDAKYLDVWVNQPSDQPCGASGDQYQSVGILAAGQSITKTYNLIAPATGAPWTFRAFVDSGCQTVETSDGNNQTTLSYGANPVGQPDFLVTSISLSPSYLKPGDKFAAFVTVKNQGTASGDAGWLDVWANNPTPASCGDSGDSYSTVGILSPGQSKTITIANLTAVAGNSTLRAFVDSACQTAEASEANNQSTYSYVVGQRVLLLLHGMNTGPDTWNDFVQTRFNNSAPVITGGVCLACPIPDAKGVVCYRVAFGSMDSVSGRIGLQGISASVNSSGDFSAFDTLGTEVWDAANYILSVYPNAQITLLGHSRGGIAARAFLETPVASAEKASIVALLTTGTPHKGSRLARAYAYLQNDLDTHQQQESDIASWQVVDFLRGARACDYVLWNDTQIDVRRPTISDLADNSLPIATLNNNIGYLPSNVKYGSLTYAGTDLGILKRKKLYPVFNDDYSVFDRPGADVCDQLSTTATTYILGTGQTTASYAGDGIVDAPSQRFDDLPGFPGASYQNFPGTTGTLHIDEAKMESDITPALNQLLPSWQ